MIYNVKTVSRFDKEIKRLVKKYASLKSEYLQLINDLEKKSGNGNTTWKQSI